MAALINRPVYSSDRINVGEFLVMVGTGQGLITILINAALEFWSCR